MYRHDTTPDGLIARLLDEVDELDRRVNESVREISRLDGEIVSLERDVRRNENHIHKAEDRVSALNNRDTFEVSFIKMMWKARAYWLMPIVGAASALLATKTGGCSAIF